MIAEHGVMNGRFAEIVHRKGGILPTALEPDLQRKLDDLRARNGNSFEHRYHDLQVKAHDEAIHLFEAASQSSDDGDLREFARTALPMLRRHREMLGP
jgi:putative membrane protein